MLNFKEYLKEDQNTHMEHMEDLPFNEGVDGTRRAINFLQDLRDMLAGHSQSKVQATVKWDGAPAIFAGIDPTDGKFFVAKKGIFNKNPKVYKTQADIDADSEGDLNTKLSIALKELSKLGIKKGVYQGDIMFTHDTLKKEEIDGNPYITFHPNTIVYAVPADSKIAKRIKAAKIGVVWHTTYEGDSFETMKASFGKPIVQHFNKVHSVWMDDANYKDVSGTATFTKQETDKVTEILSEIGKLFRTINGRAIDDVAKNPDFLMLVKTYNNSKIRAGEEITDTNKHVQGLFHFIYDRFQKDIDSKKTEKGKASGEAKRKEILGYFNKYDKSELVKIYDLTNLLVQAKHMIISKMNTASTINTFLKTDSGFQLTGPEGFVAIDKLKGGAVKIVNRMEFSKANFSSNIIKGWQR